ncbi:hypothetical protein DFP72DRAFT_265639 [Ephemerocybe angulata]|uniref:Secreted protein n=1 Tax=Ephemerocybe angulata TaxID=980116 RepID=A0A8H6I404_9AGAR|nr:hypothetical protein DFP72DRAFT_265639 [Tulosesus angulatus]
MVVLRLCSLLVLLRDFFPASADIWADGQTVGFVGCASESAALHDNQALLPFESDLPLSLSPFPSSVRPSPLPAWCPPVDRSHLRPPSPKRKDLMGIERQCLLDAGCSPVLIPLPVVFQGGRLWGECG